MPGKRNISIEEVSLPSDDISIKLCCKQSLAGSGAAQANRPTVNNVISRGQVPDKIRPPKRNDRLAVPVIGKCIEAGVYAIAVFFRVALIDQLCGSEKTIEATQISNYRVVTPIVAIHG